MDISNLIITAIAVLICISIHEWGHAVMAYALGDKTAKNEGRLTVNPFAHIDPIGFLALLFLGFGWAKPVPVRTDNFKHYNRDMTLVALAGPMVNFITAILVYSISSIIFDPTSAGISAVVSFLVIIGNLCVGLGTFNLLPIPPLDGSKIFLQFLPRKARFWINTNIQFIQFFLMLGLITNMLDAPLYYLINSARNIIFAIVDKITFFI